MLDLRFSTPEDWLEVVRGDFDAFLIDHAACERKAAATGMSFVVRYPDRKSILDPLIEFSREELEHFQRVYRVIEQRGLTLTSDYRDPYVNALRAEQRTGGDPALLDRLLVAGIVEARGCERLQMISMALPEQAQDLEELYLDLTRAESRHHALFFRLARGLFGEEPVQRRADQLLDFEAELVKGLPHRAAVH